MNIKQIEYVIAISKLGSFSAAAKAQFVTVQAVSKAVSDLENELGHALFIRESRGVHPTTFGSAFCVRAAGVVSELDVLKEFALNYDEENGALTQLRLALCTPAFGDNEMVRENIATFISHYLDIPTTMDLAMGSRGMEGLASRRFDALITVGTLKRPEVECDVLGTVPAGVMMRRGHDLAKKDRVSLDDLKPYPIALADWFDSANDTIVSIYQHLRAGLHFEEIGFNDVAAFLNRGGVFLTTGIPAMQRTHPDTAIRLFVPHDAIDVPLCIVYLVERREPLHAIAERMREASQQILNHGFLRSTAFTRRKALARPREFPPRNPTMKKKRAPCETRFLLRRKAAGASRAASMCAGRTISLLLGLRLERLPDEGGDDRADDRGDDEHPELGERRGIALDRHDDGRAEAAGRVHRRARQRHAHDVHEGEREADDDAGERRGALVRRRTEDGQNEDAGQHDLDDDCARGAEADRRLFAEAIAAQARRQHAAQGGLGDDEGEQCGGAEGADELAHSVTDEVFAGQALVEEHAEGDGGVDVATRDVADDEGHGDDRQAEGERDAQRTERGAGDGNAAATEERERERAERFGCILLEG